MWQILGRKNPSRIGLNHWTASKFSKKQWIEVNDFSFNKYIRFKTPMLRSDLCDHSNGYIVLKGRATDEGSNDNNQTDKKLFFKNNAPFKSWIKKINIKFIDNVEDPYINVTMYNQLEKSDDYSVTSEILCYYYRDEVNHVNENNAVVNYRINKSKARASKRFEYKTKILANAPADDNTLNTKFAGPLKCLSSFWRSLVCLWLTVK